MMRGFAGDQVAVWKHMDWSATRVTLCAETHPDPPLPLCPSSDPLSASCMPPHNFTLSGTIFGNQSAEENPEC